MPQLGAGDSPGQNSGRVKGGRNTSEGFAQAQEGPANRKGSGSVSPAGPGEPERERELTGQRDCHARKSHQIDDEIFTVPQRDALGDVVT